MLVGVGEEQRHLTGDRLHVMHDEGKPPVEQIDLAGIVERPLGPVLGQDTGSLPPDRSEKVAVLVIQLSRRARMLQQREPEQPLAMDQRHDQPGCARRHQPFRAGDGRIRRRPLH